MKVGGSKNLRPAGGGKWSRFSPEAILTLPEATIRAEEAHQSRPRLCELSAKLSCHFKIDLSKRMDEEENEEDEGNADQITIRLKTLVSIVGW